MDSVHNTVGQVGLGHVGVHYADHLLRKFKTLVVYDMVSDRAAPLVPRGAKLASTPSELAEQCYVVVLALPSPTAVREVVGGDNGILSGAHPGTVIVDLSTVDPETSRDMCRLAKSHDVEYLDSPMSGGAPGGGGTDGARQASVTFMVGGSREALDRVMPVMQTLGKSVHYLGPSGAGSTVKLISNYIAGLHNLAAAEALTLGAAAGFAPEALCEVLSATDASSYFLSDYLAPRLARHDFEPGFTVNLMLKDHRLVNMVADALGVPMVLNDIATYLYEAIRASGRGHSDLASAVQYFGELASVNVYDPRQQTAHDEQIT